MSATILMTTDTVGGVWRYALDLAAALERRGVRIVLATMGPLPSHEQRREAAAAGVELHESDFQPEWQDPAAEDLAEAGRWLMHMQALVRPTLVHLNGYVHASLPWQTPVVVAASSCVCTWWQAVRRLSQVEEQHTATIVSLSPISDARWKSISLLLRNGQHSGMLRRNRLSNGCGARTVWTKNG